MFTYFITPFQSNYSLHNAKTFCTFFFLFLAILRCATLPTRPWPFQGWDFPPKLFCHGHFDFCIIYLLLQKANTIFIFFFLPWIHVQRLPPGVAAPPVQERRAVFCVGCRNHKRFFLFPDFQDSVSLNHTTYPAVSFLALVHFPLCFYQPIPTEF